MAKSKLIASAALAAGLLGGGVAGYVLGVPGVSGAQTTTVPNEPPSTTAPGGGQTNPDRPPQDGRNCPHMGGQGGQAPSGSNQSGTPGADATNAGFFRVRYHPGV